MAIQQSFRDFFVWFSQRVSPLYASIISFNKAQLLLHNSIISAVKRCKNSSYEENIFFPLANSSFQFILTKNSSKQEIRFGQHLNFKYRFIYFRHFFYSHSFLSRGRYVMHLHFLLRKQHFIEHTLCLPIFYGENRWQYNFLCGLSNKRLNMTSF